MVAAGASGFMTGADKTKLDGVATGATANSTDASLRARASHTGDDLTGAFGIADTTDTTKRTIFDASGITTATTRTLTLPNNSGQILITAGPQTITGLKTLPAGAIGQPSLRIPHGVAPTTPTDGDVWTTTGGFFSRINGVTVDLAAAGGGGVTDGDKGDITVTASGATWTIDPGVVSLAKQADVATGTVFYRKTALTGSPEVQTLATLKTDLGLTGTNSGDQTITLTGDVAGSGSGSFAATIAPDAITNAKLANVATATIKGRVTAATGDPEDLTGTQATTLLDTFTSTSKGLAPASGGGTTNFLRADGAWTAAGGGNPVAVQDEGVAVTAALSTLNFTGAGVTVTGGTTAVVNIPAPPASVVASRIRRTTNQSIPTGAGFTDLVWDASAYQTGGTFWTTGATTTIPEAGTFQIFVEATFDGTGLLGAQTANLQILLNGVTVIGDDEKQVIINGKAGMFAMAQRTFAAGDTIKVQVKHSDAGSLNVLTQGDHSPDIIFTKISGAKGDQGSGTVISSVPATDQANWAPAGFSTGQTTIKVQPTTNAFIGGLVGGTVDQVVTLINDSAFVVMLIGEDTNSTAENRFTFRRGSYILLPQGTITMRYSATTARWERMGVSRDLFEVDQSAQLILPNTGATVSSMGMHGASVTATVSNVSTTATPTNDFLEYSYWQISNATAAGSSDVRGGVAWAMRGATPGRQGFLHTGRVRFPALGATGAVYAGLLNTAAATVTQPSGFTNAIVIGAQNGATTLSIYCGSATPGSPTSLGANFPVASATAAYEYLFYAQPASDFLQWMVRRIDTRFVTQGTISALTNNLPLRTIGLSPRTGLMVGATGATNTAQANYLLTVGL